MTVAETPNLNLSNEELGAFNESSATRAEKIRRLLSAWYSLGHITGDDFDSQVALGDLLADTMHFARAEGFGFEDAVSTGTMHFEEEIEEDAEQARFVAEHAADPEAAP